MWNNDNSETVWIHQCLTHFYKMITTDLYTLKCGFRFSLPSVIMHDDLTGPVAHTCSPCLVIIFWGSEGVP